MSVYFFPAEYSSGSFLDASTHLIKILCTSSHQSVDPVVGSSISIFLNSESGRKELDNHPRWFPVGQQCILFLLLFIIFVLIIFLPGRIVVCPELDFKKKGQAFYFSSMYPIFKALWGRFVLSWWFVFDDPSTAVWSGQVRLFSLGAYDLNHCTVLIRIALWSRMPDFLSKKSYWSFSFKVFYSIIDFCSLNIYMAMAPWRHYSY